MKLIKKNTINWRIYKYNLIIIIILISITTFIFNIAVRFYIENDNKRQLERIVTRTEETALVKGPDFFHQNMGEFPPPPKQEGAYTGDGNSAAAQDQDKNKSQAADSRQSQTANSGQSDTSSSAQDTDEILRFYFMLDRSLREPLSVLNANYILLDNDKKPITKINGINVSDRIPEEFFNASEEILEKVSGELKKLKDSDTDTYLNFNLSGVEYIAAIRQVSSKNTFGLGWIIIYSNLSKVNEFQTGINMILLVVLLISAIIIAIFSSSAAKKISAPFSTLNAHIGTIAERNFGTKINLPVYDEMQEFVNNINVMSEKLESYDKAQKTFLQNASHEFRTPLMSIQSYAEGIKYDVVDNKSAVEVILDETRRMTHLVEDLLYLSRLDTIEENYRYSVLDLSGFLSSCAERMQGIAKKNGITIDIRDNVEGIEINADEEKLSRAVTNILSNCIRYAKSRLVISAETAADSCLELVIADDGPGFDEAELPNIFERFYKGKKGNFGLGLAITKNVIEKHNGKITAMNTDTGAKFVITLPIYLR